MKKLKKYIKCTSKITLKTGLHIGGPKESLKIGGIDNPVIRNPISQIPYIPGSSLKGRFRMALELKYNDVTEEKNRRQETVGFGPSIKSDSPSKVCLLFGSSSNEHKEPTRLIFRDSNVVDEKYIQGEEKIELKMDRESLKGFHGGNRTQERIAAGAEFNIEIMMRIFEGDDEALFKNRMEEARQIVELEFLGGSGSRGYGQVTIDKFKCEDINI